MESFNLKRSLMILGIYLQWGLFFYGLFWLMNIFLFEFVAATIALIISVEAFFNNKNIKQHNILKRPVIEVIYNG